MNNIYISKRRLLGLAIMAAAGIWLLSSPTSATAQTALKIGVGECTTGPKPSCSTYTTMFRELRAAIGQVPDLTLIEHQTKGSVDCADQLIGNQVNGCIMQADVLFSRKRNEDLTSLKTLVALHTEEVHFVAPVNSGVQREGSDWKAKLSGGKLGKEGVVFNTVSDLNGYLVGAVQGSGSAVTARLIKVEGDLKYEIRLYENTNALIAGLNAGEVQAAVWVGGQRLPVIDSFGPEHKLLAFTPELQAKLKDVYTPSRLTYSKMNAAGVPSVSTRAELVVYEYKTPKMVQALAAFRAGANSVIPELAETTGTHAKWKEVAKLNENGNGRGKWTWYELPTTQAPATKNLKK